jgi:hypothetical protein
MLNATFPLRDEVEPDKVATDPDQANTDVIEETEEQVDLAKELAEAKKEVEDLTKASDRNVRKLQGSYQQQVNTLKAEREQDGRESRETLDKQIMSGMEEGEALVYRNLRLEEEVEDSRKRLGQMQQAVAESQARSNYTQQFLRMSVDPKRLNNSGTLQELADSGWDAVEEMQVADQLVAEANTKELAELREEMVAIRAGLKTPTPQELAESKGDLIPPLVATHTPGDVVGPKSWTEAREAQKDFFGFVPSEEELIRAVETKRLLPSVLPGLETGPPRE